MTEVRTPSGWDLAYLTAVREGFIERMGEPENLAQHFLLWISEELDAMCSAHRHILLVSKRPPIVHDMIRQGVVERLARRLEEHRTDGR